MMTDATLNASLRRVAKAVRYAASRAPRKPQKAKKRAPKIAITPKRRATFDWLFANGRRYHIEDIKGGCEVWDLKVDKIVKTTPSRLQAERFVEAMELDQ
jgi:hypothetical protein